MDKSVCGLGRPGARDGEHAPTCSVCLPQVLLEVSLDRKPTIGEFLDKARSNPPPFVPPCAHAPTPIVPQVEWDDTATGFACSATDGFLYVHELLGV